MLEHARQRNINNAEVSPLWQSHHVIHHGAAGRIGRLAAGLEEPGIDPLADDDVGELQVVLVDSNLREAILGEEKHRK